MADTGQPGDKPFLYDAFISYRHVDRDRKWAEWLIDALERYRVPKALQDKGLPPRLRKVFRDEDEVPASPDLNDQIRAALTASRYLIVICSAFTPRSKWVEREIQIFNELGRGDQVLALLTEGEPADSFPSAMLERHLEVIDADGSKRIVKEDKEPLAADVRVRPGVSLDHQKRMALLRLVAVILGVKFDDLRQREHARERKQRLTWVTLAAALVLLVGGGSGFYWDLMRPKTVHYRQLVWRWGVPEGLGEIDGETRAHLEANYSIATQRPGIMLAARVTEARRENSAGSLQADADGQAHWVVDYPEIGPADKIQIFNDTDRLIREDVLKRTQAVDKLIVAFERGTIAFTQAANQNLVFDPLRANQQSSDGKSDITRHELTFDKNGFVVERRYQDDYATPRRNAQDSFGEHYSYSPDGLITRRAEIGPDGKEITLKNGVRAVTFDYDGDFNLVRYSLVGPNDRPTVGSDGYAYFVRQNDRWGNEGATTYYGVNGKPTLHKEGYAVVRRTFSDAGHIVEMEFFDADGKPTLHQLGIAKLTNLYDARGHVVERDYFGIDGKPTLEKDGYTKFTWAFDARGHIIEERYFGLDGRPTLQKNGYASFRRSFDQRGNMTEEAYFDVDGKPTPGTSRYAGFRQVFDEHDQKTELAYFGVDDEPTLSKESIAKITYAYAHGNEVERDFFGADGRPALIVPGGYAGFRQAFDERGNHIETKYFGIDGGPTLSKAGIAAFTKTYDARGNIVGQMYLGIDGKPTLDTAGVAGLRQEFDDAGNPTKLSNLGTDGSLTLGKIGWAAAQQAYDDRGNLIELDLFGIDGKLRLDPGGFARTTLARDQHGNVTQQVFFGIDGKPTPSAAGVASLQQAFDDRGHKIELAYLGIDGKPILSREGIARITYAYDARGNEVERSFFGVNGTKVAVAGGFVGFRQVFDNRSNLIAKTYFGVDGEPTPIRDGGFAKVTWTYDARGNLTEESYFGQDGKPAHDDGCVTIKYAYDNLGREIGVTYLDAQNRELQMELVVRSVIPGGVGANSGLTAGDRIISYDGQKATSVKRLQDLEVGVSFRVLAVRRGSQILTFTVVPGDLGVFLALAPADAGTADANAPPAAPGLAGAP